MRGAGSTITILWTAISTRRWSARNGVRLLQEHQRSGRCFLSCRAMSRRPCLLLSFNGFTILLGFSSLGVVGLYPFMKRISSCRKRFWARPSHGVLWSLGGSIRIARAGTYPALLRRNALDYRL